MGTEIYVLPLLNKLRKLLADVVITHPKFRNQVPLLIDKLESFLCILEDDEDRGLPDLVRLLGDVEDKIDAFVLRTEEQRRKRTHQLLSRLNQKDYTHDLDNVISELCQMLDSSGGQLNRRVGTGHTMRWENIPGYLDEASNIVGRKKEIEELVKRLLDYEDKTRVIPVVGEAGSGKTTLVKKIYNRVDIKRHFECCAWVHLSTVDERNLLADIVKQVMVMINEQRLSNGELKLRLHKFLEKKRYLIVLDGARTTDVWDSLSQALPADTENGSKIILATVDDNVAQQANPEGSAFQVRLLTDEESWALFLNKVTTSVAQQTNPMFSPSQLLQFIDEESGALFLNKVTVSADDLEKPDLIDLRYQILRICKGSPLAILLLGALFSTINLFEWSRVIEHENFAEYESTLGEYESVFRSLAMSYQGCLYVLKCCVLYMCLFPRENEIAVRRLFGLWIADNMVIQREETVAEDLAHMYFNELVGRNMIEVTKWQSDGRPKACRMPGIIYDFLLPKALRAGFLYVPGNTQNSTDFDMKRCANFFSDINTDSYQKFRSLHSYVSSGTRKQGMRAVGIGRLLIELAGKSCYGLLMVLDLEGVYKPLLPKELGKLLLVRYLGLRSTVLDSLPSSVEELQWLETLDVKHTNITNLPSSILKGKKLRHLYLNGINLDMSIDQQSSGSLDDLQTLSGISIGSDESVRNGLNRFTGLRKLSLTCHWTAMEAVADWISKLTNLQTLKLRSVDTFLEPSKFEWSLEMMGHCKLSHLYFHGVLFPRKANLRELPQNLKILTLSLSRINYDPMPILGELHHLKTVRLLAQSYLGKKMICNRGSFPQLRILKLWMLKELEEWRIEEGAMPRLSELEIRCCQKLKGLVGLQHAATLKELILTDMPEEFVTDLKARMRKDLFININNWDLSASDLWDDSNAHED